MTLKRKQSYSLPTSEWPKPNCGLIPRSALLVVLLLIGILGRLAFRDGICLSMTKNEVDACPQAKELIPIKNGKLWGELGEEFGTERFMKRAVDWLGGAVRIPTESYDEMGPIDRDTRWEIFGSFHEYLTGAFPLIHLNLERTAVNTYALVYHWQGSDPSLKPILLAAHQDVVPVDPLTIEQWVHPPYSGHFDGKKIWGRGSSDDKSGLIGAMVSIEMLLENNFDPTRSVVLAFGFDEESRGVNGAQSISKYLLSVYGENAFALLIAGFSEQFGAMLAVPGIAEKGYLDIRVEVTTPGGHSSIPPVHTSIGMLSKLLVEYESNPYETHLSRSTPVYDTVQCLAAHAPSLPSSLRRAIKHSLSSDHALKKAEKQLFQNPAFKALASTTHAIDLVRGGLKTNSLPVQAWAVVNRRIASESSVENVKSHDTALLRSLASKFNLSYTAFGVSITDRQAPAYGTLTLTDAWNTALDPAPITPTDKAAAPFQLLSGTIKATYNAHRGLKGDDNIVVAPGTGTGNTDTRHYWKLTKHIFRYNHRNKGNGTESLGHIHAVNEFVLVDSFIEMIRFFTSLVLNADEATKL